MLGESYERFLCLRHSCGRKVRKFLSSRYSDRRQVSFVYDNLMEERSDSFFCSSYSGGRKLGNFLLLKLSNRKEEGRKASSV